VVEIEAAEAPVRRIRFQEVSKEGEGDDRTLVVRATDAWDGEHRVRDGGVHLLFARHTTTAERSIGRDR
jgi:hypothetical protein